MLHYKSRFTRIADDDRQQGPFPMFTPKFEDRLRSLVVTAASHVDESVVVLAAFGSVHILRRESDIGKV
jgi:hypothetical protein